MPELDKNCTLLVSTDKTTPPSSADIQKRLENPRATVKAEALEELITAMVQGETYAKLLMTVIRFVVTSTDHRIKKLLMIYWEIVDKHKPGGQDLKEEMILVCNALRNDLMSANEYVRGSTLRLLCKMRYFKILEPLTEAILRNLSHRHSYVRRNAVMCIYSIVKTFGIEAIPHAVEEVEQLLLAEGDVSTKRNAFLMLLHCDQERAVSYVLSVQDVVSGLGDIFQLVLLDLLRKVCRQNPAQKTNLLRIVVSLVQSASPAVAYECASTLIALSSSPHAVKSACEAYVKLLVGQSDNNVKLIVLGRLSDVLKKHKHTLQGFVLDILRALSCPSVDVRKKTMEIGLRLVTARNIQEVIGVLKKEIIKTTEEDQQNVAGNLEYRQLLIRSVHASCGRFPDVAQAVIHLLLDFIGDPDQTITTEVVMFVRELVANYPLSRTSILQRIRDAFPNIQQSRVMRVCLWVLGEYAEDKPNIEGALQSILDSVARLPFHDSDTEVSTKASRTGATSDDLEPPGIPAKDGDVSGLSLASTLKKGAFTTKTVIMPDGTYGTEKVYDTTASPDDGSSPTTGVMGSRQSPGGTSSEFSLLRTLIKGGDFLLSSMLAVTLTKLVLKPAAADIDSLLREKVVYCVASLLKLIRIHPTGGESCDAAVRISQCLRALIVLLKNDESQLAEFRSDWFPETRDICSKVLEIEAANNEAAFADDEPEERTAMDPDDTILFRQLRDRRGQAAEGPDDEELDIQAAITGNARGGSSGAGDETTMFQQRLAKVQQMTGVSDPLYVEAFLQVHEFDLVLELLVVNRTQETLQNVNVELSTHGDLKLVDRPAPVTLAEGAQITLTASIKVQSTETGIIFGYVTYDRRNAVEKECLVLNEMDIDLLDYIQRSWIDELAFRTMWSEFEWENKINIATSITDVSSFWEHIMRNTNMTVVGKYARPPRELASAKGRDLTKDNILTPKTLKGEKDDYLEAVKEMSSLKRLTENSSFFAVNLYSKSIFGEDALANLSIEKLPDGKLAGSVRIRSRTQGIALSLGDRITVVQRSLNA